MKDGFEWTQANMKNLYILARMVDSSYFQNKNIYINIPLTWETTVLVDVLRTLHSQITIVPLSSGNSGSIEPKSLEILNQWSNVTCYPVATTKNRITALKSKPDILFDCTGSAARLAIKKNLQRNIGGILELTRTGVIQHEKWVKENLIHIPIIPIDNCPVKRMGENRYATGLSLLQCLLSLNIHVPSKKIAIIGYGSVGRSCAHYLKAIGTEIFIIEKDSVKRLLGKYDACLIEDEKKVLHMCDIIITATGQQKVLDIEEFNLLKNGVILVNMGARAGEWNRSLLKGKGRNIFPYLRRFRYKKKNIYEMAEGNSVNLAMGASVIEIMDMTFSVVLKAMEYLLKNKKSLSGICRLPKEVYSKAIILDGLV